MSHAYLFVGTRGTGKTTCAKILARAVNCRNPLDGDPCNECASCIGIENGGILDVLELDAASNNKVDDVRALREEAIYSPASVKKRVFIIDEVHMLSSAAFNALLKILEEPPEHLVFILATTELHKVPATILSRCQRFSFKRISPQAISARLHTVAKNEGLTLTDDAVAKLSALADGSMRDALSLLDQCASDTTIDLQRVLDMIGLAGHHEIFRLADAAAGRNVETALEILDRLYDDGKDMASLLNELASIMRDVLVYKLSPDSGLLCGVFGGDELFALSAKMTPERLFFCLDLIREAVYGLQRGGAVKLSVEMCLIRICDERMIDNASALLPRIARLEERGELKVESAELKDRKTEGIEEKETGKEESDPNGDDPPQEASPTAGADNTALDSRSPASDTQPSTCESQLETDPWGDILGLLKDDGPIHALLSDSAKVRATLSDDALIISAGNKFVAATIETPSFSESLKDAARKTLGRDVVMRIETGGGEENRISKIDNLRAFDIVKFE
jgi:DNA polymerase-3 subunit gamma/tau